MKISSKVTTKTITVIGNGQIGQAIIYLLKKNEVKNHIEIYDKDETKNESHKNLKDCLSNSDFVFLCVPSWCLKDIITEITKNKINSKTIFISLSKGIDASSKESVDTMVEKNIKKVKYAMLSGPMFAKEILQDKDAFAVLASKDKNIYVKVSELFKNTNLKLEYSKKVHSVAFSGVLKNIYTLAISIINNSLEDNNMRGFLSVKAIKEMLDIMKMLKLDKEIILGTSGLGDFITTVSSEYSQNRKVGIDIATTGQTSLMSEGLVSLSPLISILGKKHTKLPMLCLLEKILIEKKDSKIEIEKFLNEVK